MQMQNHHALRLLSISSTNTLSLRDRVTTFRRISRHYDAVRSADRSQYRRDKRTAELGLPFTRAIIDRLNVMDKESHQACEDMMLSIGAWLIAEGGSVESTYTLEEIYDLLNVNPVHRIELNKCDENGAGSLYLIAHNYGLEDSASQFGGRKERDFKDGPFFWCYMEVFCDHIKKNPGSFFGAMSKPGGPLHGIPAYRVMADGSVTIERPSLAVHEKDGSVKVVQRQPEVIGKVVK